MLESVSNLDSVTERAKDSADDRSIAFEQFELRFDSLFKVGRSLVFPCDREGHVDLDRFSERAQTNYLFARAMLGREYAWPWISDRRPS